MYGKTHNIPLGRRELCGKTHAKRATNYRGWIYKGRAVSRTTPPSFGAADGAASRPGGLKIGFWTPERFFLSAVDKNCRFGPFGGQIGPGAFLGLFWPGGGWGGEN